MTRGEIIDEYRRMNADERSAFHHWLITSTVAGALGLLALIVVVSIFPGEEASSVTADKAMSKRVEAR